MKSSTFAILGASANVVAASPWGWDKPQTTVTVTSCPSQNGAGYVASQIQHDGAGQYGGVKTITVTEISTIIETLEPAQYTSAGQYGGASTITITETSTVKETFTDKNNGGSYYTNVPPKPGMTTSWSYNGGGSGSAGSTGLATATGTASGSKETFHVQVGTFDGMVKFVPNSVNAQVGDVVEFDFLAKSHSLSQSEFLTPCTFKGGFDTGLNQPNPMNISGLHVVPLTVSTEKPQWFYCKQPGPPNHCGKGMVFGLNPGNKMDQFIQNAIKQNGGLESNTTTKTVNSIATSTYTSEMSTATGVTTTITVGLNNGTVLKFDPPYLPKVNIGDKLHFDFRALNHTLTESSLEAPCLKLAGTEVDTNFQNANKLDIPDLKPFDLTITEDKSRFFYCKQANHTPKGHCGKGMVFAINVDGTIFNTFEQNAEATGLLPLPMKRRFAA